MARSISNDPLDKFRFKVWVQGNDGAKDKFTRAGFQSCQMPKRNTNKVMYREGTYQDISLGSAGLSIMEDIVLSKGLVPNNSDFYAWAKQVHDPKFSSSDIPILLESTAQDPSDKTLAYRREVIITMYDRTGVAKRQWKLFNAFPINFTPGSDLDASADDGKSIASITLHYDDFIEITASFTEV